MIDFVEMKCKYCGGQLTQQDQTHVHCPYCGKTYMIDTGSPDKVVNVYQTKPVQNTDHSGVIAIFVILGVIFAFFVILGVVFSAASSISSKKTDPFAPPSYTFSETAAEEIPAFSPLFEAFLMDAFNKPGVEVTEEELASIRYFSFADSMDSASISYSKDMPKQNGVPENVHTVTITDGAGSDSLDDLSRLKGLVAIDVGNRSISASLQELNDLKMLSAGNSLESLANLVTPEQLTVLSLNGHDQTLDGLSAFSSLTALSVDSYELTDIRGLASLTNLTSLSLDGCDMTTDYSVLYTLNHLQALSLIDTSVKEIGFVSEMPDLSSFTLDDSSVLDLSPLADCTGLTSLVLTDCSEAVDFSFVDSLTGLTSLELSLYSTQKMPTLTTLSHLEKLTISGAKDISFLASMPQLKELSIFACDVSRYDAFSALTKLETLSLKSFWGDIPDLSFLHTMPELQNLDLSGGEFYGAIDDAFCLQSLRSLNVSDCSFALNTENLVPCESLQSLNLNRITLYTNVDVQYDGPVTYLDYDELALSDEIGFLQNYPNLTSLSVSGDKLSDLSFIEMLPLLETLNISENYFSDLRPLDKLTHLKTVYCADNAITKYPASEKITLVQ